MINKIEIANVDINIANKIRAIADGRKLILLSSEFKEDRKLMYAITGKKLKGYLWVEVNSMKGELV